MFWDIDVLRDYQIKIVNGEMGLISLTVHSKKQPQESMKSLDLLQRNINFSTYLWERASPLVTITKIICTKYVGIIIIKI